MATEPCAVCGDDTALGRAEYIGRREAVAKDGTPRFLCGDCEARSRPGRRHELSDEQRRRMDEHALMFGLAFNPTGH
jgi:hypothetical protein